MLDFGWKVATADSESAGSVSGAMYDRTLSELTGIIVRRGAMATRDIVTPVDRIASITDELITLSITSAELESLEDFRLHRYVSPSPEEDSPQPENPQGTASSMEPAVERGDPTNPWTVGYSPLLEEITGNVLPDSVALSDGQEVVAPDGQVLGHVVRLLYDDDEQLSGIIVRGGGLFGSGKLVSLETISEIALDRITLTIDREQYDRLPDAEAS